MKVIVGSKSKSKINSVKNALKNLFDVDEIDVVGVEVDSGVNDRPINEQIIIGAKNRNKALNRYCLENQIEFDFLISLEGGFEGVIDNYYIVTYVAITDSNGNEASGKSTGLHMSNKMFEYVEKGNSLNRVIEKIIDVEDNKSKLGITGYLTNGELKRDFVDENAVIVAFLCLQNKDKYSELEKNIPV